VSHRVCSFSSGALIIAALSTGCSGEPAGPSPGTAAEKPPPVYSDVAKDAKVGGKVTGKRSLNTTGPAPGKLRD
jgi:hypothetical protein